MKTACLRRSPARGRAERREGEKRDSSDMAEIRKQEARFISHCLPTSLG